MTDSASTNKVAGLTLMAPTPSRNYWRIKGTLSDGRVIDTTGGRTVEDASAKAESLAAKAAEVQRPGAARHNNVRYAQVLREFVKPQNHDAWGRNGGSRYAVDIKSLLWNHVLPVLGNRTCDSLQPSDFRSVLHTMRSEGYSPSTIKNVGGAMRSVVTFMRNERYIEQGYDPMQGVSYRFRAITGGSWVPYEDRPTIEHKDALADGMAIGGDRRWWVATHLAALAGPRWGELIYLTPRHFDLSRCEILIERQWNEQASAVPEGVDAKGNPGGNFVEALPKNGRERTITYPAWLNPHLQELMELVASERTEILPTSGRPRNPLGLMFCTKVGTIPWRSTWNRDVITPARKYANWPSSSVQAVRKDKGRRVTRTVVEYRWTWHSLRHLFCALTISNDEYGYGLEPAEGAKLAGHTLEVFLQKYVQAPPDFTTKTARKMAQVPAPRSKPAPHIRAV
jgi:integrase